MGCHAFRGKVGQLLIFVALGFSNPGFSETGFPPVIVENPDTNTVLLEPASLEGTPEAPPGISQAAWDSVRQRQGVITFREYMKFKDQYKAALLSGTPPGDPVLPGQRTPNPSTGDAPGEGLGPEPVRPPPVSSPASAPTASVSPPPTGTTGTPRQPTSTEPVAVAPPRPDEPASVPRPSNNFSPPPENNPRPSNPGVLAQVTPAPRRVSDLASVDPDGHGGGGGPDLQSVMQDTLDREAEKAGDVHPTGFSGAFENWVDQKNNETDRATERAQEILDNPSAFSPEEIARSLQQLIAIGPSADDPSDRSLREAEDLVINVLNPAGTSYADGGSDRSIASAAGLPLSGGNYFDRYESGIEGTGEAAGERLPSTYGPADVIVMKGELGGEKGKAPGLVPTNGGPLPTLVTGQGGATNGKLTAPSSKLILDLAETLKSQRRLSHSWLAKVGVNPEKARRAVTNARRSVASVSPVLSGVLFPGDPRDPSMIPAVLAAIASGGLCAFLAFRKKEKKKSARVSK